MNPEKLGYRPQVRLCFCWAHGNWIAYDQSFRDNLSYEQILGIRKQMLEARRRWVVVDHGGKIGEIQSSGLLVGDQKESLLNDSWLRLFLSRSWAQPMYDIGWIQPVSGGNYFHPDVARSQKYAFFGGIPTRRPLLLISKPFYRNPEKWSQTREHHSRVPPSILQVFKNAPDKIIWPKGADVNVNDWIDGGKNASKVFYRDEDLEVRTIYRSASGDSLYAIGFRDSAPVEVEEFWPDEFWLGWEKGSQPVYLGRILLLEIGDFNGDGKSEFIFMLHQENRDGYRIVWDGFARQATSDWRYH